MSNPEEELRKMAAGARNHGCQPSSNIVLWCETEIDLLRARVERLEGLLKEARENPNIGIRLARRIDAELGGEHGD